MAGENIPDPDVAYEGAIERIVGRAFLAAQLLTGSAGLAESTVLDAIESWNPESESPGTLFHRVLRSAAVPVEEDRGEVESHDRPRLPAGLDAILRLPSLARRCYVLRVLTGQSRLECARLLRVNPRRVDQQVQAALRMLPAESV